MQQFLEDFKSSSGATIVSICNFPITEDKTGITPNNFKIPKAEFGRVSVLHVEDGFFYVYIDDARGSIRSITPALRMARSIVEDYSNAQLAKTVDAEPGLFYVQGHYTIEEIEAKFPDEIKEARRKHTNWAERLVTIADDMYAANNKRSAVSDRSRDAARFLALDRVWLKVTPTIAPIANVVFKTCPVCFENVHPEAIVCRSCKAVLDKKKYEEYTKVA